MRVYLCFDYGGHLPWDYLIRSAERIEASGAPVPLSSHSYFTFVSGQGGVAIIEAVPPKVRQLNNPARRPNARSYELAEQDDAATILTFCRGKIGTPYDLPGLLVAAGFATAKEQDHFYEQHHAWLFCSEFCTLGIRQVRPCLEGIDADCITPAHLEAWAASTLPSADRK
jgi:hypothetical protein